MKVGQGLLRHPVVTVLRWAFGVSLAVGILISLDVEKLGTHLQRVSWSLALPALAGLALVHVVGAAAWKVLSAEMSRIRLDWTYAIRSYYAAQAVGGLTPANLGADAYRAYALTGGDHGAKKILAPIIGQRITSYIALLLLGGVAALFAASPFDRPVALIAGVALAAVVTGLTWALGRGRSMSRLLTGLLPLGQSRLAAGRAGGPDGSLARALWAGLALALLFHVLSIGLSFMLTLSIDGGGNMAGTLAALTLARLAILLPLSPNGLGFQEGALAALFPTIGRSAEAALTVSLLSRLALVFTMLVGLACMAATSVHPPGHERASIVHRPTPVAVGRRAGSPQSGRR